MSNQTTTPYAATYHGEAGYRPVEGYMCDTGSQRALAQDAQQSLCEYYIVEDDDDMVDGVRVLARGWYDVTEDAESPAEFAARLFRESQA